MGNSLFNGTLIKSTENFNEMEYYNEIFQDYSTNILRTSFQIYGPVFLMFLIQRKMKSQKLRFSNL